MDYNLRSKSNTKDEEGRKSNSETEDDGKFPKDFKCKSHVNEKISFQLQR